jgi:hypothetical protein
LVDGAQIGTYETTDADNELFKPPLFHGCGDSLIFVFLPLQIQFHVSGPVRKFRSATLKFEDKYPFLGGSSTLTAPARLVATNRGLGESPDSSGESRATSEIESLLSPRGEMTFRELNFPRCTGSEDISRGSLCGSSSILISCGSSLILLNSEASSQGSRLVDSDASGSCWRVASSIARLVTGSVRCTEPERRRKHEIKAPISRI